MSEARGGSKQLTEEEQRYTRAELVTFVVSLSLVLALVGLVTYEYYVTGTRPAAIEVESQVEALRVEDGRYYLPVAITNTGDRTATDVWVRLELVRGENALDAGEVHLPTLAGGQTITGIMVFEVDPRAGVLTPSVSFIEP